MALATFANRAVAALVASRFLTLADAMGYGGASLLLAAFCLLVAAFVYVAVPETKARARLSPRSHIASPPAPRPRLTRIPFPCFRDGRSRR